MSDVTCNLTSNAAFNPMEGTVAESGGGLPPANYSAEFVEAEHLPAVEADPMSGEGGRKWAKVVFKWRISEGEHKDKFAVRETPVSTGGKSAFILVCGWVMGKQLTGKDGYGLKPFVGRKYLLTIGNKADKNGNLTQWTHVVNAMLVP